MRDQIQKSNRIPTMFNNNNRNETNRAESWAIRKSSELFLASLQLELKQNKFSSQRTRKYYNLSSSSHD